MLMKVAGIDPSLNNTGIALGTFDTDTGKMHVEQVHLISTDNETGKTVRRNSDDLRRCQQIAHAIFELCGDADVIFGEVPTGAQSARAAFAFGMVIGIIAGVLSSPGFRPAFIQVLPHHVKSNIPGGSKTTSKEEIIMWAAETFPLAGWEEVAKGRKFVVGKLKLGQAAEHPADACAAINAGILTDEFRNLRAAFTRFSAVNG